MINRLVQKNIISKLSETNKIIVLYGSRQVGKTTLINELLKKISKKALIINADIKEYADVLSSRELTKIKRLISGYELIFIDEAQRIKDIGINLKILYDEFPGLKIITTGSSSFELANVLKEPLTGRTYTYSLYPIAVSELKSKFNLFELDLQLENFLLFGMYPEIFSYKNSGDKIVYLKELSSAYLYKDILELADIRNSKAIFNLLKLLAYQIGSTVSVNELANQLQLDKKTVSRYIDLLEKAFIIFRLSGFSRNLRKEVVKMDKIFFYDVGIRNAVINNFNEISDRQDVGELWENFLIAERIKYLSYNNKFANKYYWRTYTGAELDYIEETGGKLFGFEFKWGKKIGKAPKTWLDTYKEAEFKLINRENYFDFILDI